MQNPIDGVDFARHDPSYFVDGMLEFVDEQGVIIYIAQDVHGNVVSSKDASFVFESCVVPKRIMEVQNLHDRNLLDLWIEAIRARIAGDVHRFGELINDYMKRRKEHCQNNIFFE